MLYLAFISIILEMIGAVIAGIVIKVNLEVSTFWWALLALFVSVILLIIISEFIKLTKGSIEEHIDIYDRVIALEEGNVATETKLVEQPAQKEINIVNEKPAPIVETTKEEKEPVKKEVKSKPVTPQEELKQIRVKGTDVSIANGKITIDDKSNSISGVKDLSVMGNELHFVIGKNQFIVEYDYFSEASKMYDEIDKYLSH